MKISEALKAKKADETFSAGLIVFLLIVLPTLGGAAMLVASAIGLVAYTILFREQLRGRGWLRAVVIPVTVAVVLGAVIAIALTRGHWH